MRYFWNFCILLLLGLVVYVFVFKNYQLASFSDTRLAVLSMFSPPPPACTQPEVYTVGTIDPSFKISKAELVAALKQAEIEWESKTGIDLFTYSPNFVERSVVVNLVNDGRQEKTVKAASLLNDIDSFRQKDKNYKAVVKTAEAEFLAALDVYNKHVQTYNATVALYNASGGATSEQRAVLEKKASELKVEQASVMQKRAAYDRAYGSTSLKSYGNINDEIQKFNTLVQEINGETGRFDYSYKSNAFGLKIGEKKSIEIFAFADLSGLVSVLEHEMGHAIGLDHSPVSGNIMSAVSREDLNHKKTDLTPEDVRLMLDFCNLSTLR